MRKILLIAVLLAAWVARPSALAADTPADKPAEPAAPGTATKTPAAHGCVIEKFTVASPSMKRNIEVAVLLPPAHAQNTDQKFPVLYTLHGRGAPYEVFVGMRSAQAALKEKPMIIVGFNGDRAGWYLDASQKPDSQFTTFFFKELIPHIEKNYRAVTDAKGRGVTGFSMGGFGAFHYMLVHPHMFAGVSSMSGALESLKAASFVSADLKALLGDPEANKEGYAQLDLRAGLEALIKKQTRLPPVYLACGTEDGLIPMSRSFCALFEKEKLPCECVYAPGKHNYAYWQAAMTGVIDFHWRTFQGNYKPMQHPAPAPAEEKPAQKPVAQPAPAR